MRPITNILLVLALICYLFLPFQDISLMGKVTGLGFTAGTISQSLSISNIALALLPFIACFGAVALNCMKRRWWVLGTIACILLWLWFYSITGNSHDISLEHAPEVTPDNDLGEGFSVIGMGIGYKLSRILAWLSLISAVISMLPFKFNETIEKAVDDTFEDGRRHVRQEFKRLENAHKPHKSKKAPASPPTPPPPTTQESPEPELDKEDPSRFMPH
jgi:4-amino-4-deoxy-L-arabinose transferase-like glycosyltransferase